DREPPRSLARDDLEAGRVDTLAPTARASRWSRDASALLEDETAVEADGRVDAKALVAAGAPSDMVDVRTERPSRDAEAVSEIVESGCPTAEEEDDLLSSGQVHERAAERANVRRRSEAPAAPLPTDALEGTARRRRDRALATRHLAAS